MFSQFQSKHQFKSKLFNEGNFYTQFLADLDKCRSEVIIESPFITTSRMELLYPVFQKLINREIAVSIITRDPNEYEDDSMKYRVTNEILQSVDMGIKIVLQKGYHHRKIAIIDRRILWEGSLNILSQTRSKEIMRRLEGGGYAEDMFRFLKLGKLIR